MVKVWEEARLNRVLSVVALVLAGASFEPWAQVDREARIPLEINAGIDSGEDLDIGISGQLTTPEGDPVTCAVIEAILQGSNTVSTGVTDLTGAYSLANLADGVYDIRILAPDFGIVLGNTVNVVNGSTAILNLELLNLDIERSIRGQVLDKDTNEPLVSVLVELLVANIPLASTYTCAAGEYQLGVPDILKGLLPIDLRFTLINYDTFVLEDIILGVNTSEANAALEKSVSFPASLSGFIRSVDQGMVEAIPGSRVTIRGETNISAISDETGAYSFDAILDGSYIISASAVGFNSVKIAKTISGSEAAVQSFDLFRGVAVPIEPSDLNGDGTTNAIDVQIIINVVLGVFEGEVDADVNEDALVNSIDIQLVINRILGL